MTLAPAHNPLPATPAASPRQPSPAMSFSRMLILAQRRFARGVTPVPA